MVKGVWTFEVPEEKQEEYLKVTAEIIKPFWEARGCLSYQVFQDYKDPRRFVKDQIYPDRESLDRDVEAALEKKDPKAVEIVNLFRSYAQNIVRRHCIPRIDENGLVEGSIERTLRKEV